MNRAFGAIVNINTAYIVFLAVGIAVSRISFAEESYEIISARRYGIARYAFKDIAAIISANRLACAFIGCVCKQTPVYLAAAVYIGYLARIITHAFIADIQRFVFLFLCVKDEIGLGGLLVNMHLIAHNVFFYIYRDNRRDGGNHNKQADIGDTGIEEADNRQQPDAHGIERRHGNAGCRHNFGYNNCQG